METITWDLHGTIIKSNPEFKKHKPELIRSYFGITQSDEAIFAALSTVGKFYGNMSETYGLHIPQNIIFASLLRELGIHSNLYEIDDFIFEYEKLYLEHHPVIYDENTVETMQKISHHCENIVISNISFVSATTITLLVNKILKLSNVIDRLTFSGHLSMAKPNKDIYFKHAAFHVGDNIITDKIGPESVGVKGYIINSNDKTILDFYNHLSNETTIFRG